MATARIAAGFTLLETLVALFLAGVATLAAAPMFMHAAHANDAGADLGAVGVAAVDCLERLRKAPLRDLEAGGSLTSDLDGYFEATPNHAVRWTILDNAAPSKTKTITVLAMAPGNQPGPRRRVELTLVRGR